MKKLQNEKNNINNKSRNYANCLSYNDCGAINFSRSFNSYTNRRQWIT